MFFDNHDLDDLPPLCCPICGMLDSLVTSFLRPVLFSPLSNVASFPLPAHNSVSSINNPRSQPVVAIIALDCLEVAHSPGCVPSTTFYLSGMLWQAVIWLLLRTMTARTTVECGLRITTAVQATQQPLLS